MPDADPRPPRVAVVDDDTVIRLGTPLLLSGGVESAGGFPDVDALLAARPAADVVLLDLVLSGTGAVAPLQGAAGVRAVADAGYRALIYTNERRRLVLAGCLRAGARGVVHKAESIEEVLRAVAAVHAGEIVITTALAGLAEVVERYGELPALTPRQQQVLSRRARGETFQQIAGRLGISRKTAEEHMSDVSAKFLQYLRHHSAADLERHLGLGSGDLLNGT